MLDKYALVDGCAAWEDLPPEQRHGNNDGGNNDGHRSSSDQPGAYGDQLVRRRRQVEFDTSNVPYLLSSYVDPITSLTEVRSARMVGPGVLRIDTVLDIPPESKLAGAVECSMELVATQTGDEQLHVTVAVHVTINASYLVRTSVESLISSAGAAGFNRWAARAVNDFHSYLAEARLRAPDTPTLPPAVSEDDDLGSDEFYDTFETAPLGVELASLAERIEDVLRGIHAIESRVSSLESAVSAVSAAPTAPTHPPPSTSWLAVFVMTASLAALIMHSIRARPV